MNIKNKVINIYDRIIHGKPELIFHTDFIERDNGGVTLMITLTGKSLAITSRLTDSFMKDLKKAFVTGLENLEDDDEYEGVYEAEWSDNDESSVVKVCIICRPGNLGRYITDKDLVASVRETISNL